ncbi:Fic family protein [Actinotalea sp. BY-33]|uniref:Fic family protein n=1 Tax=Actinotalea soli TaxID=2819234 RepID=A0A939LVT5_9CELL|nr:Fic family protein [Actinotalea soli]MBO1753064.1 Fic family protein [Actinotalea soli]
MPSHPLDTLVTLPGVEQAVGRAREACEELRWHRALRRQWPVARTEAGVRCAHAGGVVDGLRLPLALVRDLARGAAEPPSGPEGEAAVGGLRAQAEVERRLPAPGARRAAAMPLGQLLARLDAAAVGDTPEAGRPRTAAPQDLRGLGEAVGPDELGVRLGMLAELVAAPLPARIPALLRAAVVLGEVLTLRPFVRGNGVVGRAAFRYLLTVDGVDPVGVVVPEVAWAAVPTVHLAAAAGFATGTEQGVAGWLVHCAEAVVAGAEEGTRVADAVLAGRLAPVEG